jgi:hypothetical protein
VSGQWYTKVDLIIVGFLLDVVTTLAGSEGIGGTSNGVGTSASMSQPLGIAVLSPGLYIYFADHNGIRRVSVAGSIPVYTVTDLICAEACTI